MAFQYPPDRLTIHDRVYFFLFIHFQMNGMVNQHICTYLQNSSKAKMFKTLQDSSFIENTSPTFKILNSLCYDVSKFTASVFPSHPYCGDEFKLLFLYMFESFWTFFKDPFHQFEAIDMFDGSRKTKFKSYVKSVLQRRLRENLKKHTFNKHSL